jgi:glutathione synthase/RimK-type ligase-like ATP-grasp enzyme
MQAHIHCLLKACDTLSIPYQCLDVEQNFIKLNIAAETLFFQLNKTPFNQQVLAQICLDKSHSYLLFKDQIQIPKTLSFLDFAVLEHYQHYVQHKNMPAILVHVEQHLSYPLVVKPNKGSYGINAFLCDTPDEAEQAFSTIFNKDAANYDYVGLAQQYIPAKTEYRVVCFRGEIVLCYARRAEQQRFNARYWETGHGFAEHIQSPALLNQLKDFLQPILNTAGLDFVGYDVLHTPDNKFYLLELNSGPQFKHFIEYNGDTEIIKMYQTILQRYIKDLS